MFRCASSRVMLKHNGTHILGTTVAMWVRGEYIYKPVDGSAPTTCGWVPFPTQNSFNVDLLNRHEEVDTSTLSGGIVHDAFPTHYPTH
jgi:hypothetical protein